jgi:hypothetical protein
MKDIFPSTYVSEEDWNAYLRENVLSLASLWNQGKHEAFETWKALSSLTYEDYYHYVTVTSGFYYSPYMPMVRKGMPQTIAHDIASVQPMSETTATVYLTPSPKS